MSFFPDRFKGQVALITGAASGLGKAIAQRLGEEGASLALFDRNNALLQKTKDEFLAKSLSAKAYTIDVANEEQVIEGIEQVEKDLGKIDILIHSAGIVGPTSTKITDYSTQDFDNIYAINLKGSFLMTKYVIKKMETRKYGRILLIASMAGKEGNPGMIGYSTTKAGVIGLVKSVGKEYATAGITINALAPAVIRTAMNADTSPDQLAYLTAKIPMNRLGEPEEVAAMVSFIVSEENSFSTGFLYDISGGRATY
ncbi:NAD(P)-dependent dehydrogenase (short-subunit alcohol dehydrogenase family) [Catalinimonas alkaloidigena]|uniref:SDR family NAD(P)-dependent oxidoreductase n=1 Tax=Catalinimonas alkaloidigena TaxID=1075417 RepID=UPI0024049DE0|nr:SDR family NAD(P)-dependent oxidoreductase [Catalinimonas alkaloidigena]MDF9794878.1 NAD(P)-dependent dehydrogenase (short-subunit alcohol dehydrogenase family) [Catalinimonas alkaloidigena]